MHRASLTPCDPSRAPTTKDFAEEGRPVEIRQSSWLCTPNCPKQGSDKVDLLPLHESNQISDNSARLGRVVRRVGDNRGATRASQLECISQMFGFGGIERLARNVTAGARVHSWIKIGHPPIAPKLRQAAAERAIAAARIERNSWQIKS